MCVDGYAADILEVAKLPWSAFRNLGLSGEEVG